MTQQQFNDMYWAHQPPPVRALMSLQGDERASAGFQLAMKGYLIDKDIMIDGWDPFITMSLRKQFGYTWVPSALGHPVQMAPGLAPLPGMLAYDPNNPPMDAIKVSVDPADYPQFMPPAPPPPPPVAPTSLVGGFTGGLDDSGKQIFFAFAGSHALVNGQLYNDDPRGVFKFHSSETPFGSRYWFTLEQPKL